jgi:hypothetical protein
MKTKLRHWLIKMLLNDVEVKQAVVAAVTEDVQKNGRIVRKLRTENWDMRTPTPFYYPREINKEK